MAMTRIRIVPQSTLKFHLILFLHSPPITCRNLLILSLSQVHPRQVLILHTPQVLLPVVDELTLDGFIVFLVPDKATLVEFCAVLLYYVLFLFGRVHALQSAAGVGVGSDQL